MAAYKTGAKTVIIPLKNQPDVSEIDAKVKENVEFIAVSDFEEVLAIALADTPECSKKPKKKVSSASVVSKSSVVRAKS